MTLILTSMRMSTLTIAITYTHTQTNDHCRLLTLTLPLTLSLSLTLPLTPGPAPAPPAPSGPEPGIDQHGGDLPHMPINITRPGITVNESVRECEALCQNNSACHKWAIDIPGCASSHHKEYTDFECWLKAEHTKRIENHCRISGVVRYEQGAASAGMCTLQSLIPGGSMTLKTNGSCGYWATKLMINNEPAPFLAGLLSQGFWPDGEYAVPDDKADIFELESEKAMGFNFIRKHIKVGPHRWYYHADRLGFFVFQDMPETIHGTGRGATFTQELRAMVLGRRNHPSIIMWDIFNEASPSPDLVQRSAQLIRELDPTRPVNANSGFKQQPWWGVSDVQDFHSDGASYGDINASLMVSVSEAHRCGCLPPKQHMWFHALPEDRACYSVEKGVDCDASSATYMPWAQADASAVRYLGLGATGYVQNRDMEGECNGLLTYDAVQKLNATPIVQGNRLLTELHDSIWRPTRD